MEPTTSSTPLGTGYLAEDLHWALSLVEDWLLHASRETLEELAQFAFGGAPDDHHDRRRLAPIIELLGIAVTQLGARPAGGVAVVERRPSR